MPYLIATVVVVVVVVGVLCVLNLLLTWGVIRRLREHTELLAQRPAEFPDIVARAGSTVGGFTATTVDGDALIADDLATGTLVGFFSPGCGACVEQLPRFVDAAAAHPGGRNRVLAVVVGAEEDVAGQVAALSPKARVVVAEHGSEIEKAFGVTGYPGYALIGAARVVMVSGGLDAVAAAVKGVA
jgi:thiol-disulfide isomerase/thioredoxin